MAIKPFIERSPSEQVRTDYAVPQPVHAGNGKRYIAPSIGSMAFHDAPSETPRRIICALGGMEKCGKDHTALTAPDPIYIHSFDRGIEGVVQKFRNGVHGRKQIGIAEYPSPDQVARSSDVQEEAKRIWKVFEQQYYDSLASTRERGTVIVDTGGECFDLLTLAEHGRTERILPRNRGGMNARMTAMIRAGFGAQNVFWLHKLKDQYRTVLDASGNPVIDNRGEEKSFKTGEKILRAFNDIPYIVQLVGRCERVDLEGGGSMFQVRITDCRHSPAANGLVVENNFEALTWALFDYVPEIRDPVVEG